MSDRPGHTTRSVPLTDSDRAHLQRLIGEGYATNWGCLLVFAALPAAGLFFVGRWAAGFVSAVSTEAGSWIGLLVAAGLLARVTFQAGKGFQTDRRRARQDLDAGVAEEIEVRTSGIVLLGEEGTKTEPRLAFDIGDGKLLVLAGFWMQRPLLYGAPNDVIAAARRDRRALQGIFNRLPPPWSFPCSEFTLRRLPASSVVLSIRIAGEPLDPTWVAAPGLAKQRLPQSLIVEGALGRVADAVTASLTASSAGK